MAGKVAVAALVVPAALAGEAKMAIRMVFWVWVECMRVATAVPVGLVVAVALVVTEEVHLLSLEVFLNRCRQKTRCWRRQVKEAKAVRVEMAVVAATVEPRMMA
jgi:membrane protein CcdC involved in cytochrome C biogenesis